MLFESYHSYFFLPNSNLIFSLYFFYVCKVGFSYTKSPSNKNTVCESSKQTGKVEK